MKLQPRRVFLQSLSASVAAAALPGPAWSAGQIKPGASAALIVVDVQNCFVSGGTLPLAKGEEADRKTVTGLAGYLKARGIQTVYGTGLATDFCVGWTALDARKAGFEAYVVEDACRAIDLNGSLAAAWKQMAAKGVKRIQSADIALA